MNKIDRRPRSGLRDWVPAVGMICVAVGCGVVLISQELQIQQIGDAVRTLQPVALAEEASHATSPVADRGATDAPPPTASEEAGQLQEKIDKLTAEIAELNRIRSDNDRIRAQLAAPPVNMNAAGDVTAMQAAKERAQRIACANNLKQLGLAARIWAGDNNDTYPPDIISMSNEMNTPKILVCPADTRQPAAEWAAFSPANCSYDYLAASANELEPNRVMFRCAIHGNYALCDGSVQTIGQDRQNQLVERNGKLYVEAGAQ